VNDPLLSQVRLKPLEEIVAAAKETIHRHRRRFLQKNLRPCPTNCQRAETVGYKVVGCSGCGTRNAEHCIKEGEFRPIFTKDELAKQFADQLRDPEVLLREYRDVTVFFWVLGAFDKQKRTVDEQIVSEVERNDKAKRMAAGQAGVDGVPGDLASPPDGLGRDQDQRGAGPGHRGPAQGS
jgi:hypothetical protein